MKNVEMVIWTLAAIVIVVGIFTEILNVKKQKAQDEKDTITDDFAIVTYRHINELRKKFPKETMANLVYIAFDDLTPVLQEKVNHLSETEQEEISVRINQFVERIFNV